MCVLNNIRFLDFQPPPSATIQAEKEILRHFQRMTFSCKAHGQVFFRTSPNGFQFIFLVGPHDSPFLGADRNP